MKMFREDKEKWLAALESGEYEQARYKLFDGKGGFCCLGVLQHCLMNGKVEARMDGEFSGAPSEDFYNRFGIIGHGCVVPKKLQSGVFSESYESRLMFLNDGDGEDGEIPRKSFAEIAAWIRKNVKVHKHDRTFKVPTTYLDPADI